MIVKTTKGWVVKSKDGSQRLSKPYPTKEEAMKRMGEIEFYKNKGKNG